MVKICKSVTIGVVILVQFLKGGGVVLEAYEGRVDDATFVSTTLGYCIDSQ
jgi:hypothetical protein